MKRILWIFIPIFLLSCNRETSVTPGLLVPLTVDQDPALPSVIINGTHLHAETFGNSNDPIIIMIHGGPGGDYRSMLDAKSFAKNGFFVVFYDQRGTGLSKREPESQFSQRPVQLMIDDLDALIANYRETDSQKVFLIGHSWGGMLATAYINQHPQKISGAILAEPGGFTWEQTQSYLSRSNKIDFFSEAFNDALFPEQIFAGRSEHEILDYKAAYFATFENAPGNTIGNAGPYPFWRNGVVSFNTMIAFAEQSGFDFTQNLHQFTPKVLFTYSELNTAYGAEWAQSVGSAYSDVEYHEVKGSGHEMLYFGWNEFYPLAITYLNKLK